MRCQVGWLVSFEVDDDGDEYFLYDSPGMTGRPAFIGGLGRRGLVLEVAPPGEGGWAWIRVLNERGLTGWVEDDLVEGRLA